MQSRTPAGTQGAAKCSFNIINEAARSRDTEDKRFPPSEKTLLSARSEGSPHAERAQRHSPPGQAGWESQPPFRQMCKKRSGRRKKERQGQAEGGRLQTNLPLPRGKHLNGHGRGVCRRCCSVGERVKLKHKPTFTHSHEFLNCS